MKSENVTIKKEYCPNCFNAIGSMRPCPYCGNEQFDRNQMRKMTHLEYFPHMGKMLLFDYKFRNPLNQEARTCMIKKDSLERRG